MLLSSVIREGLKLQPQRLVRVGSILTVSILLVVLLGGSITWIIRNPPTEYRLTDISQGWIARHEAKEYRTRYWGAEWIEYQQRGGFEGECALKNIRCTEIEHKPWLLEYSVDNQKPVQLILPLFQFPAWHVTIDGNPVPSRAIPTRIRLRPNRDLP